jgi:hypothetical protein
MRAHLAPLYRVLLPCAESALVSILDDKAMILAH